MHIEFDKATVLLAVEYLCDNGSGFIEINNSYQVIQKNTLKDGR